MLIKNDTRYSFEITNFSHVAVNCSQSVTEAVMETDYYHTNTNTFTLGKIVRYDGNMDITLD